MTTGPPDARKKILVIDDNANNLAIVAEYLEVRNFTVLSAEDGETGIDRATFVKPDLILLDVMMPGIDGYETCRRLKCNEETADIPVIFMTALSETRHKVKAFLEGGVDYVTKPLDRDELLARVEVHLRIRELTKRLEEANVVLENRVEERTAELAEANRKLRREIAERTAAETDRERLQEQLRQAQKMEAIGTFAGGIAHDFNNILTAILGFAELMKSDTDDVEHDECLDEIIAASERAANLTHSLLTFSRKQLVQLKPVDLNGVVRSVERILRRVIGEEILFVTTLDEQEPLTVMADMGQIAQVLMNLASNARDAMPDGGELSITTCGVTVVDRTSAMDLGDYAVITVSDNGTGMSEDIKDRIFEPFFTTKDPGRGTGLGLSIVHGIIKQHNGEIEVRSEPGRGTTFSVYLKRYNTQAHEIGTSPASFPIGGTETILVAEDDTGARNFLARVLQGSGYNVIEAIDGDDAVAKYNTHLDSIDLVILDVIMPKKSGKVACKEITGTGSGVPVLFLSGYSAEITDSKAMSGEIHILNKPVHPHLLLSKIREMLAES